MIGTGLALCTRHFERACASVLLGLHGPVHVVNGARSNLAFGATFPDGHGVFWDAARLRREWAAGPVFLISVVGPDHSVVRDLAPVHRLVEAGGRRLDTNAAAAAARGGAGGRDR